MEKFGGTKYNSVWDGSTWFMLGLIAVLSSPATSLSHRLAITFTDRNILKSSIPLLISPMRQEEFIRHLLSINPEIKHLA